MFFLVVNIFLVSWIKDDIIQELKLDTCDTVHIFALLSNLLSLGSHQILAQNAQDWQAVPLKGEGERGD